MPERAFREPDGGILALKRGSGTAPDARPDVKDSEEPAGRKRLLCKRCRHLITSPDLAAVVSGSHSHVFMNPVGVVFRIGCYFRAPGCLAAGVPTEDFTWFPGYSWCFALCGSCTVHLGWLYRSGSDSFYGLILANLVEEDLQ